MTDNVHYMAGSALPDRDARDWLTSAELVDESGISWRQLDYWSRTGLLQPIHATPGSGHLRRFEKHQLLRARLLVELLAAGISLHTCRQVIDEFAAAGQVTVGSITLTRTGGDAA